MDPERGGASVCPPTGSNSFVFTYVFTEKHPHQRLAPPQWLGTPPMGNPGSATDSGHPLERRSTWIRHCLPKFKSSGFYFMLLVFRRKILCDAKPMPMSRKFLIYAPIMALRISYVYKFVDLRIGRPFLRLLPLTSSCFLFN